MDPMDRKLDELLNQAAPRGAPPGFADRVVAATRSRRRRRRLRLAALSAAAVVAACLGLAALAGLFSPATPVLPRVVQPIVPEITTSHEAEIVDAVEPVSFAVQLPPATESDQRVIMARINDTFILVARPKRRRADERDDWPRPPSVMTGSVTAQDGSAWMAAQLK